MFLLAVAQALATSATHHVATPLPVNPVLHSPLPVSVKDLPGPDEVARKTLEVANRTLLASIIAIAVGLVAIGVAIVDAWNNRRQLNLLLREPNLEVDVRILKVVARPNGDGFDVRAKFRVANLESGTCPADNVTVSLRFPQNMVPTEEWVKENDRWRRADIAIDVAGISSVSRPALDPRKLISMERLAKADVKDGYRVVTFYDQNAMQLLPGTTSSVSGVLRLHVPEKAKNVEWKALSVQGTFPKNGRGKIDLVTIAKENLADASAAPEPST
jgi:hypothetical protein